MGSKRRVAPLAVIAIVASLALAACGSSGSSKSASPAPSSAGGSAPASASAAPSASASASSGGSGLAAPMIFPTVPTAKGGVLTYGADQEQTGFNDDTSKDNGTAAENITEGIWPSASYGQPNLKFAFNKFLFTSDPTEISTSPQTIEYKINPKAVWSDGVPINEADFAFNALAQNGKGKYDAASTSGYSQIASVAAKGGDMDDVIVTYATPYSDWASLFSPLVPAHVFQNLVTQGKYKTLEAAWEDGLDASPIVSGGPFMVSEYKTGDHLTLVQNPKWYGTPANLTSIIFRYLPVSETQPQALENKEVQLIYPQPQLDEVDQIAKLSNVKSELNFGLSFEHIDFNLKTPGLSDVMVRKAIATALNRPAIIARTVGQFSKNPVPPLGNSIYLTNQPNYVDGTPAGTTMGDAAGADKILEADGYAKGSDGYYAKAGTELSFKFTTTSGNALREQTAALFQSEMKAAGIKINLDERPSKVVFPDLAAKKFDISLFAWVNTTFPASGTQQLYMTGSDSNYGSISDPAIDADSAAAVGTTDPATEAADLNKVNAALWAGYYTIPLFQKPTYIAYDSNFVNIHDNPTSDGPFYNAYTWGTKAQ